MACTAAPPGGKTERIRFRFRQRDQLLQILHRDARMRYPHVWSRRRIGDRCEILLRAISQLLVEPLVDRKRGSRRHQQDVTARLGPRDERRANRGVGAGAVLDEHRDPHRLRHKGREGARNEIGAAAGSNRAYQRDRTRGERLGERHHRCHGH